jgi:hypothetical protein
MPDQTPIADPFAPADNAVARLATRLGRTEGGLYSLAFGAVALWALAANTFTAIDWHPSTAAPPPFALAGTPASPASQLTPPPVIVPPADLGPLPLPTPMSLGEVAPATPTLPSYPLPPEPTNAPAPQPSGPLRVTGGGYAAADAGTPLATAGIPAGSAAVGSRAGQVDKVTYVRLSGTPGVLQLKVDASGANVLDQNAVLAACPVTQANWQVGQGEVTPTAGPPYSCGVSSPGVRSSDGTSWTFELSSFDLSNGVAIVPVTSTTEVSKSFQVVFRLTP